MLVSLDIRDVVLIERLNLSCGPGLTALTGETGAGKSILLDALGLALGARADAGLVRKGAGQASVSAVFETGRNHPVRRILEEQGLVLEEDMLILRRNLSADGRSRAFINDQAVSVALLKTAGALLVEIHGQFETQGLLDDATHAGFLDAFGGHQELCRQVSAAWKFWREAQGRKEKALQDMAQAKREEDWLRHAAGELETLSPRKGEEEQLAQSRALMMNSEKLITAANAANEILCGEEGVETLLGRAQAALEKVADKCAGKLDDALAALGRAALETEDALGRLQSAVADIDGGGAKLEGIEERLFTLRDCARKHNCTVDGLVELQEEFSNRLALIDNQEGALSGLETAAKQARKAFDELAQKLSAARIKSAKNLDKAVMAELPPLKLEKAKFATQVRPDAEKAGPQGIDQVSFTVATNAGADAAPLSRIASGGELARFTLALKVVLAREETPPVLIFDEVDSGIGGAVADAVGQRLLRLGSHAQVFCVTHSPQVAARAQHHLVVSKQEKSGKTQTQVTPLRPEERLEEIARMLSGEKITTEARAAAARLMETREHAAA